MTSQDAMAEDDVFCLSVDVTPTVTFPSVFLKTAQNTVFPIKGKRVRHYSVNYKSVRNRERFLVGILFIFATILLSMIASIVVMVCRSTDDPDATVLSIKSSDELVEMKAFYEHKAYMTRVNRTGATDNQHPDQRQPCIDKCLVYSAFRFRSQCISGYCNCKGRFYDEDTCLPDVLGCKIRKNISEAEAFFDNKPQHVFSCSPSKKFSRQNHVISTYGHHNSDTVTVDVIKTSSGNQPITLILANYFPTKWRLNLKGTIQISKIHILSDDHVTDSFVDVFDSHGNLLKGIAVKKEPGPVGYGDDRSGAHTVGLLRYIISSIGQISSFSGSHFADRWRVSLDSTATPTGLNSEILL